MINTETHSAKSNFIKSYKTIIALDMEVEMINFLSKINLAPTIISANNNTIVFEKINGITLYEILELLSTNKITLSDAIDIFERLVLWLDTFDKHVFSRYNHYIKLTDFHYKNFMIDDTNKIYGIDFEQYKKGEKIDNYISLLAWFKLYNFENTQKINELYLHISKLIANLLTGTELNNKVESEILKIHKKRKMQKLMSNSTAVVMCGGKSERMGGFAKANLMLGKYTFLQHILYALNGFDNIAISCASEAQLNSEGQKKLVDTIKNIGPIGGIYTALNSTKTENVFITSCDFPLINETIIHALFAEHKSKKQTVITKTNGKINPLLGIYSKTHLNTIEQNIKNKNYKIMSILNDNTCFLEIKNMLEHPCYNINTTQQYDDFINTIKNSSALPYSIWI